MPANPSPLPPIPAVTTLDDVVEAIASIIDWSIGAASRLGYFAALYKQITVAVRTAVRQNAFEDGPRMERFDVAFAARYFDALNGYFHPDRFAKPTRSWRRTFTAADDTEPILVQHLVAGVTAHICLDLGIVVPQITGGAPIAALRNDFNTINAVLGSQLDDVIAKVGQISPALGELYDVLGDAENVIIGTGIRSMRDSAWRFATLLSWEPKLFHGPTIWARDHQIAAQVRSVYGLPKLPDPVDAAVHAIAEYESRDVAGNIRALDVLTSTPAPIQTEL